jgi:hypothetical protein
MRQGLEEFRFEIAQLLPHLTLWRSDDLSQMIAGFSICESLQMVALTPTRVKPARRSDSKEPQIASPSTPAPQSSAAFRLKGLYDKDTFLWPLAYDFSQLSTKRHIEQFDRCG